MMLAPRRARSGEAGALLLVLAWSGCFRSASEPPAMDLGRVEETCEGVCFEWLPEPEPVCTVRDLVILGCPAGYDCVAEGGDDTNPWRPEGVCRRRDVPGSDPVVFASTVGPLSPEPEPGAVDVSLALSVNGARWGGSEGAGLLPLLHVLREETGRQVNLGVPNRGGEDVELSLLPGRYSVYYQTQNDISLSGSLPRSVRTGRLEVAGSGRAEITWSRPELRWSTTLDGSPPEQAGLSLFPPDLQPGVPRIRSALGASLLLAPGAYAVFATLREGDFVAHADLGEVEVLDDQELAVALRSKAITGRVRMDGGPLDAESASIRFRTRAGATSFAIDPDTGRYAGRLVEGRYDVAVLDGTGFAAPVGASVPSEEVMDFDVVRGSVSGSVRFRGRPITETFESATLRFAAEQLGPGIHRVPVDAEGRFETQLAAPARYRVIVEVESPLQLTEERVVRRANGSVVWGTLEVDGDRVVDLEVPATELTVRLSGAPLPTNDPELLRGLLVLRSRDDAEEIDPHVLPILGEGPVEVREWVASGRYDLFLVRPWSLDLAGPLGETLLGQLDLAPGESIRGRLDVRAVRFRGRLSPWSVDGADAFVGARPSETVWMDPRPMTPIAPDGSFELSLLFGLYDLDYRVDGRGYRFVHRLELVPEL